MISKKLRAPVAAGMVLSFSLLAAGVSCSSDSKSDAAKRSGPSAKQTTATPNGGVRTFATNPGEAGGVVEDTMTTTATVLKVDPFTRKIQLQSEDGSIGSFTAPPDMRNIEQLRAGDRVKATAVNRLTVFVDDKGAAGAGKATVLSRAPKGAKPGALVAETYELVGTITSIDTANRQAAIQFPSGQTKYVNVRPDVDLKRYKPGSNVVIQVTQQVTVSTESP
jgi:hypothetical protein